MKTNSKTSKLPGWQKVNNVENYQYYVALALIVIAALFSLSIIFGAPKIDEGNNDIYGEDFVSLDDDRGEK
jgi:hypothetical protein